MNVSLPEGERRLSHWALALALAWLACSSQKAVIIADPGWETRYRAGDFIVYRYTGSLNAEAVLLREEVLSQVGNRLEIDVVAKRGSERRHWVQVVTDTPRNQANNIVDELYEVVDGERHFLPNPNNEDLSRLYSWVLLTPDRHATDVRTEAAQWEAGGESFQCLRIYGKNTLRDRPIEFSMVECPRFVWSHATSVFWDVKTGTDLLRAEVVEVGKKTPAPDAGSEEER